MCGIAGIVSKQADLADSLSESVRVMTARQHHRGPDDEGLMTVQSQEPSVVFGHRRLSIIDLSPLGHQPMESDGYWITFNGEIYNFLELRNELQACGYSFRSKTDTEVILKAYQEWGHESVGKLRGIFAFAIWDTHAQTLFIARDQLGVKPLYLWQDSETILFASEVRAILASGKVSPRLSYDGLASFLTYGSVQEPFTLVQDIQSLKPGHYLTWQNGISSVKRYWDLDKAKDVTPPTELYREAYNHLFTAVQLQLVADVPLGAFLSGGIDSTAIAALAQQALQRPLRTFSIIFDESEYDERQYSRKAAEFIGTEHTELLLTETEVLKELPAALRAIDQPSMDGLNTYFVSKVVHEAGLTVALSGVGGDELFGGYEGYSKPLLIEKWAKRTSFIPSNIRHQLGHLLKNVAWSERQRSGSQLLSFSHPSYFLSRLIFSEDQISNLLQPNSYSATHSWFDVSFQSLIDATAGYDPINKIAALELQTYMLSTLLRDTDQMSMAHALEVRVPLIDHRLVEFAFALPGNAKLHASQPKPLITFALDGKIPSECVFRPKQGFQLPFSKWLRKGVGAEVYKALNSLEPRWRSVFNENGLQNLWRDFEAGKIGWSRIWGLYVLLTWLEEHHIMP